MTNDIDNHTFLKIIQTDDEDMFSLVKDCIDSKTLKRYKTVRGDNYLLFVLRGQSKNNIMLSAHVDTVHKIKPTLINTTNSLEGEILSSKKGIGGDDRAGVYAIIEIISRLIQFSEKLPKYLLFTDKEEIGCVGAKEFVEKHKDELKINFVMEFDSEKDYAVFSLSDDDNMMKKIFSEQFPIKESSYKCDIDILKKGFQAKGVNIGVGYNNWHKINETINMDMLKNQIIKTSVILSKLLK